MSNFPNEIPAALKQGLGERLDQSLRYRGVKHQDMADYLEVHRNAVGNWIAGRSKPSALILRVWAERLGLPVEWLRTGVWPGQVVPRRPVLDLVGATEAAAILKCTVATVHRAVKLGFLTPIGRLGTATNSAVVFDRADVVEFAQRRGKAS